MSVKDKVSAIESGTLQNNSKTTSTKSSVKSFEEFSEEEGDSGVTSDMSRHISDNEEFPELKKMTRYQRAATHSRLFKLLQEVCEAEEDEEEGESKPEATPVESAAKEEAVMRREQLSLPLNNVSDESFSSSGITSPGSPVSDKMVTELVQSILKRKKGQIFRNIPREKLQAAAKRILQEELDEMSTPDSSFLSPLRNSTESSTPARTPQEFYNDYKQYYDSWSDAEQFCNENYDILPSKAFKLLQEHSGSNKTGAIAGLLAKCPKILSSKNVHQELMKLMEESPESPSTDKSLEPSEIFLRVLLLFGALLPTLATIDLSHALARVNEARARAVANRAKLRANSARLINQARSSTSVRSKRQYPPAPPEQPHFNDYDENGEPLFVHICPIDDDDGYVRSAESQQQHPEEDFRVFGPQNGNQHVPAGEAEQSFVERPRFSPDSSAREAGNQNVAINPRRKIFVKSMALRGLPVQNPEAEESLDQAIEELKEVRELVDRFEERNLRRSEIRDGHRPNSRFPSSSFLLRKDPVFDPNSHSNQEEEDEETSTNVGAINCL
uniref:Uncharacterized protein n=1 Tax=Tenebrio molitor TaxID=7067 RepID=A0A8J6L6D5_TENMO|nr:hypothetical protein GEV33_014704 [Tenebrio molitor]